MRREQLANLGMPEWYFSGRKLKGGLKVMAAAIDD